MAKLKIKLTRKTVLLGSIVAIVALCSGAAVLMWQAYEENDKVEPVVLKPVDDVQIAALEYTNSSDIDGGLAFYDEEIDKRVDGEEKKQLLLYKSNFALGSGRSDIALEAAKQAEDTSPDVMTAIALAEAYEMNGNKEQALLYYQQVLDLMPKEGMEARDNYIFEQKIEELKQ